MICHTPDCENYTEGTTNHCATHNALIRIHRLVALYFIPNPENKPYINHIDCNPSNNHVSNLEWCTPKENAQHASKMGLLGGNRGTKKSKYCVDGLSRITLDLNTGIYFNSLKEACEALNLTSYRNKISKGIGRLVYVSDRPCRTRHGIVERVLSAEIRKEKGLLI